MKKIILSAASLAVAAVASVSVAPTTSEAVPAFARQTGAACLNCHFGAIPRLAQMGREFRMGGFRDISQDVLEDEHLSLPVAFNASFLMKARVIDVDTTDTLSLEWPDEAALLFGGRVSENVGAFQEWDVIDGSMLGGKFAYVADMDSGLIAFAVGTSDALGAPSIFNDPSNAITRNTRGIQSRSAALNGQPMIHDAASGLGVYGFMADSIYFALGLVDAAGGYQAGKSGLLDVNKFGTYARVAFISEIAGLDTIIGGFSASTKADGVAQRLAEAEAQATVDSVVALGGTATAAQLAAVTTASTADASADVTGLDLQLQGEIAGHQLGVYMPIVLSASNKVTGFQIYGNYNVTHAAGVQLGFDYVTDANGAKDVIKTNTILGAWYDLAQNVAINFEYSAQTSDAAATADTNKTMLELEYVY